MSTHFQRKWYTVEGPITRIYGKDDDMVEVTDDDGKVHIRWLGHDFQIVGVAGKSAELGDRIKFSTCAGEQMMYKAFESWESGL